MQKTYSFLLAFLLAFQSAFAFADSSVVSDAPVLQKFIITAYYTPLPNQSMYLRGSYTADCLLNGDGIHGASGKNVHFGMIAAPKTYAFGTKIYLQNLGLWIVEDRGWAIVGSGSRGYDADRIDVWMGSGEEGLKRALLWGKRTVYGTVLASSDDSTAYSSISANALPSGNLPDKLIKALSVNNHPSIAKNPADNAEAEAIAHKKAVDDYVASFSSVQMWDIGDSVRALQESLKTLGYFSGKSTGYFGDKTKQSLINYQTDRNIIADSSDDNAGNLDNATQKSLSFDLLILLGLSSK